MAAFKEGCKILDLPAITYLHHTCNDCGMDLVEIGGTIPFLLQMGLRRKDYRTCSEWMDESVMFEFGKGM